VRPRALLVTFVFAEAALWADAPPRRIHARDPWPRFLRAVPSAARFESVAGDDPQLVPKELSGITWLGGDR